MKYAVFSVATHPLTGKREARRSVHEWQAARRVEGKLYPPGWARVDSRWFSSIRRRGFERAPDEVRC